MIPLSLKKYSKHLAEMNKRYFQLQDAYDEESDPQKAAKIKAEIEKLSESIDKYIENDYAKAVFDYYSAKSPKLIRIRTGETYSWGDAFGTDFYAIPKSLKHSLAGLVEKSGRYKLK